jgi:glycogen debranching enzyme
LRILQKSHKYSTAQLAKVRAPEGWGVFASIGPNFQHAVFGRDSIEVAEDILPYDQALARDIILALARLQGTSYDADSEEEPGKIHHEYRSAQFAGQAIPAESLAIMRRLQAKKWSDASKDIMLYYGAYDATPLYIRLVQQYTAAYGDDILDHVYRNKDGRQQTIRGSLWAATSWLVSKLYAREDRLLAYRRTNPQGIANQVWKDSHIAYLFSDGTMPDCDKGIVSTELQGYAYDALLYAAQIF